VERRSRAFGVTVRVVPGVRPEITNIQIMNKLTSRSPLVSAVCQRKSTSNSHFGRANSSIAVSHVWLQRLLLFSLVFCGSLLPSHLALSRDSRGRRQPLRSMTTCRNENEGLQQLHRDRFRDPCNVWLLRLASFRTCGVHDFHVENVSELLLTTALRS
jgi:hypothetical protein